MKNASSRAMRIKVKSGYQDFQIDRNRIRKLGLHHIGPFEDLELIFPESPTGRTEIHILTGPNGSGKSTILAAIARSRGKNETRHGRVKETLSRMNGESLAKMEGVIREITAIDLKFIVQAEPLTVLAKIGGTKHAMDDLPDGLKSIISRIGDLLMDANLINPKDPILLLDDLDTHLHPQWQRRILPAIQKLFTKAQVFVSTHSPFVVNSISGAQVYCFDLDKNGRAYLRKRTESKAGSSCAWVLDDIFQVEEFDVQTESELDTFYTLRDKLLADEGSDEAAFIAQARRLAGKSIELRDMIGREIRQCSRVLGKELSLS